jgi:hypothetical protein
MRNANKYAGRKKAYNTIDVDGSAVLPITRSGKLVFAPPGPELSCR